MVSFKCINSATFGILVRKNAGCRPFKNPAVFSIPAPDCARDRWQFRFRQCVACFPARSPVVRPCPAVNKAVSQVRRAIRAVAQVPLLVNQPRVFINRVSVFKRPGERCYSSGKYPPDFVTTNCTVPSVIGVMVNPP